MCVLDNTHSCLRDTASLVGDSPHYMAVRGCSRRLLGHREHRSCDIRPRLLSLYHMVPSKLTLRFMVEKDKYDARCVFHEDLCRVVKNGRYGFVDIFDYEVIGCHFEYARNFNDGRAVIRQDGRYGYVDHTGKIVIEPIYSHARDFSEGLAPVRKDGKYGYIDRFGKEVIPFKFYDAGCFDMGKAWVLLKDPSVYIDKSGNEVVKE